MKIIPAIDLLDGQCVRLEKGKFSTKKIYNADPVEVAKSFEAMGVAYLHLVDLDGARSGKAVNYKILENIAASTSLQVDFSGGIKADNDIKTAFDAGAQQVAVGSIAVREQDKMIAWLHKYGAEKIILGADCKHGKIAISGWTENSAIDVIDFISAYRQQGVKYAVVTDIEKDGMLQGPSWKLYETILSKTGIALIASGGITSLNDIIRLKELGCTAAIIGKAIYENNLDLKKALSVS